MADELAGMVLSFNPVTERFDKPSFVGALPAGDDPTYLLTANNLSDVVSAAAARTNLGLGTAAVLDVAASGNAASGEVVKGSDTRLSDARTPTAHAASHAAAGSDPLTLAQSQITNLTTDLAAKQPLDVTLTAFAGLSISADVLPYGSGADAFSTTPLTAFARTLLDDANQAAMQATLALVPGTNVQAYDPTLSALAAFNSNGIMVQTAADTFAARTLTAPAAGLTVSNGNGVSGNPTLGLANDLAALEGLSSTGIAVRTGADAWAQRSIAVPAAGLSITNADGAAGNPTLALANDLAALEGLGGTGIAVRTTTDTWAQRSIAAGSGISVTNGDGAGGNPTVANTGVLSITGTANQVTASASTGAVTLSLPQNIHTGASPQFVGLTLTGNLSAAGVSSSLIPSVTDTYDLGSSTKLWRKGWLSELDAVLFAKNTVTLIGGWLMATKNEGAIPTGADVGASDTSIDFGQAMTANDFVIFRAAGAVEYVQVGSLVSGTRYNVTRNLDGTGANAWPAGSVYAVLGNTGSGRIEINANDTPRISLIRQGATYNAQTELVRVGDLNGGWGYSSETYGFVAGEYAAGKAWVAVDPTNGLRVGLHTIVNGQWDTSGNLALGQVATNSGNAFWNNSNKRFEFRGGTSGTQVQAYIDTDGSLVASGGAFKVNSQGVTITAGGAATEIISWKSRAGGSHLAGEVYAVDGGAGGIVTTRLNAYAASGDSRAQVSLQAFGNSSALGGNATGFFTLVGTNSGTAQSYASFHGSNFAGLIVGDTALSTPSATLDVKGTGRFAGAVTLASTLNVTGSTTFTGAVTLSGGVSNTLKIDKPNASATDSLFSITDSTNQAHGITDWAPTTAVFNVAKVSQAGGGVVLQGYSDAADETPFICEGYFGVTDPNDSQPALIFRSWKRLSTGRVALGAAETVLAFANGGTTFLSALGSGAVRFHSDVLRLDTAKTPASATAAGNQGDIGWDANYVYVCVATNTWKRSALSTW